jgi:UBX domain-containing protein 1/4
MFMVSSWRFFTNFKLKKLFHLFFFKDSNSQEMSDSWSNQQIASLLSKECVSLQLEASTEACKQFSEFYKILCYPTTYFIDENGIPIEIIAGIVAQDQLIDKLNKIITNFNAKKTSTIQAQATSVSMENQDKSLEQKVAEAREKIKNIQEKKAKEEEDKQRQQEIERRKMGQELIKMKQLKEQEEAKRLAEDKKRERQQEELAKKKVLEKIQQDREEKKRKYDEEKEHIEKVKDEERKRLEAEQEAKRQVEAAKRSSNARIQFRLTDGSTLVEQFNPDQTLNDVVNILNERLKETNYSNRGFALHSTYPKRVFGNEHMNMSLRELQLAPTASLLVMPVSDKSFLRILNSLNLFVYKGTITS